jgi:hypothetical protein
MKRLQNTTGAPTSLQDDQNVRAASAFWGVFEPFTRNY